VTLDNINVLISIAKRAGEIILDYYKKDLEIAYKHDNSPVTDADKAANSFILEELKTYFPLISAISEEGGDELEVDSNIFWLIDPLDGTRSFIKKGKNFTVNIALIKDNSPYLGVIYHPLTRELFHNLDGKNAVKIDANENEYIISGKKSIITKVIVIGSYSSRSEKQLQNFLLRHNLNTSEVITKASSIKFCLLAEAKADIYPRFGQTMEWDTAAGHAILNSAGGVVLDLEGNELKYNKAAFINKGFIAYSNRELIEKLKIYDPLKKLL
jgi:3'(2'), 5'-bisphosphate nucleotidase